MTSPRRTPAEMEDIILRNIFCVTLSNPEQYNEDFDTNQNNPNFAKILIKGKGNPVMFCDALMKEVLEARLSGDFPGADPPFTYLVDCYRRAIVEERKLLMVPLRHGIDLVIRHAREHLVSYAQIYFGKPGMLGQMRSVDTSPLLSLILCDIQSLMDGDNLTCPPGFLNDFFGSCDNEVFELIMEDLYERLIGWMGPGNFQEPLSVLVKLLSFPICAEALVGHRLWIPKDKDGRVIETMSILGTFFHVTFEDASKRSLSNPSQDSQPVDLRTVRNILYDGLATVLNTLLLNLHTAERVLEYLAAVITMSEIQVDQKPFDRPAMFVNISGAILWFCEDSFHAISTSERCRIDLNFIFWNNRLDLRQLRALHASSEENSVLINNDYPEIIGKPEDKIGSKKYPVINECFFITARVLNLGLMKLLPKFQHLVQELARNKEDLSTCRAKISSRSPGELSQRIRNLETERTTLVEATLCYDLIFTWATCHMILELLQYLWTVSSLWNAFRQIITEEKGLYVKFLKSLLNDSDRLINESRKIILKHKMKEAELATELEQRPGGWCERMSLFNPQVNTVPMKLLNVKVWMLALTSEETPSTFLLPDEVKRVARMLNYLLLQLLDSEIISLTVKDYEKFEFSTKQLLSLIVGIYVRIARGDTGNIFRVAISKDEHYNKQLFGTAANELWKFRENGELIQEFVQLGFKANEFLDTIPDKQVMLVEG